MRQGYEWLHEAAIEKDPAHSGRQKPGDGVAKTCGHDGVRVHLSLERRGDAGEDQHEAKSKTLGKGSVSVETVSDNDAVPLSHMVPDEISHGLMRLAGNGIWLSTTRSDDRRKQRTSPGFESGGRGIGGIGVGGEQTGSSPNGQSGSSEAAVGELIVFADDDHVNTWRCASATVTGGNDVHVTLLECFDHTRTGTRQHSLPAVNQRGYCHRRGEDVVVRGDTHGVETIANLTSGGLGIVGDERQLTPVPAQFSDCVGCPGNRLGPKPHHAIEVQDPGRRPWWVRRWHQELGDGDAVVEEHVLNGVEEVDAVRHGSLERLATRNKTTATSSFVDDRRAYGISEIAGAF
jgi:hypothetical protein